MDRFLTRMAAARAVQSLPGRRAHATRARPLVLCGGLQSSGSTLVSWCFLQRHDMDGILDGHGDVLPNIPPDLTTPYTWCKTTISAFRLGHMIRLYEDEGWQVQPLLVVRDVRTVFNSLITKPYGRNGVTAEEPPLRLRFMRFREDWELFEARGWPILRYESLIDEAEATLRSACDRLGLAWDAAMLSWPKPVEAIAVPSNGSATFLRTRGRGFPETARPELAALRVGNIPRGDLAWLEREFADYNRAFGYASVDADTGDAEELDRAVPCFENTRRYRRLCRKGLLPRFVGWLGSSFVR